MVTGIPQKKSQRIPNTFKLEPQLTPHLTQHSFSLLVPFPQPQFLAFPPYRICQTNGTLKGNSGPLGFGVVLRNNSHNIMHILPGHLGNDTNNSIEIWGFIRRIELVISLKGILK